MLAAMMEVQKPLVYLTDSPLQFEFDRDTGLLSVKVLASFAYRNPISQETEPVDQAVVILMTPGTSQLLLAQLPELRTVLQQASEGPSKPDFLQ
jgi:hypothetical protein